MQDGPSLLAAKRLRACQKGGAQEIYGTIRACLPMWTPWCYRLLGQTRHLWPLPLCAGLISTQTYE